MLAFFRRTLGSKIVLALLALVILAFIVTGVGGQNGFLGGGAGDPDTVAKVGDVRISAGDVQRRAQSQLAEVRQRQPDVTMAQLLAASGGLDELVDRVATGRLIEVWAQKHGLVASDRLVDAEIAGVPAFRSPAGVFDERVMNAVLSQQRLTLADVRSGIRGDILRRELLVPMTAGTTFPMGGARFYGALMLSRRIGAVGFVPLDMAALPAPSAADLQGWYKSHIAAYSLPERRVIRYAPLDVESVPAAKPTDAEIAAQYQADAAKYTATEQRSLSQVVLPDEKAARAFSAKVSSGTPFAKAATEAGFAAADISLGKQTKAAFASASAPAIADAVFGAQQGATVGPLKSALGWHIVHVDGIERTAAKSLEQARGEIAEALTKKKQTDALSTLGQKIEDALSNGATFDEIVKANGLKAVATPPVIASGTAPSDPAYKPDAAVTKLLKAAFQATPDDQPTVETIDPTHFALLALGPVTPGAPVPFDQVKPRVVADLTGNRAAIAAKAKAQAIVDKINKGAKATPTLAAANIKTQPANASQADLMRLPQVPPALRTLFSLAPGHATVAAGQGGFFIVTLDHIEDGPKEPVDQIASQMRGELNGAIGDELMQQFAEATKKELTIKRNPAAIAALARQLNGQAPLGQ
jgi:peptidyl-prolyl cis-trans isomerase D